MPKLKRRLSESEEFEIMKLVLDKFLWLGFIVIGLGCYFVLTKTIMSGIWLILTGAVILILFAWFIIREFEFIR